MDRRKRGVGNIRYRVAAGLTVPALLALAACSKSTNTGTTPTSPPSSTAMPAATATASAAPSSTASSGSQAAYTIDTASVSGLGTVLVNGNGQTLYVLSSESGKKVTCTTATGCAAAWPPMSLPSGMNAGLAMSGVLSSLLSTVTAPDGTRVTYAGYPLYTFAYDGGPRSDKGEGVSSFGGTWHAMAPDGTPVVVAKTPASPSPSPTPTSAGRGYGY